MDRYIDPTSDIFVIYLLGSEENKVLLLDFINSVLSDSGFEKIVDVEIKNPFNIKTYSYDKMSILDVKATDENGRIYDIEVQTCGNRIFINRSIYYWARNYSNQIVEGDNYTQLKPVICINLLKFKIFEDIDKIHTCFIPYEKDDKSLPLTDHFQIHFIELPKFSEKIKIKESLFDWLLFFKNENDIEEDTMETLLERNNVIKKAHEKYKVFTQDEQLRDLYEARLKYQRDQSTLIEVAKKEGIEKGKIEGKIEGELEKSQKTLIKQIQKKYGIDEFEISLIKDCRDMNKLDNALDEFVFAIDKGKILDLLR